MKKYTKEEVISIFELSGEKTYHAMLEGDYKTNNKEFAKTTKIFKYFEKNIDFAKECIDALLKSSNVAVRLKAASYCLALKYNINEAENILEEISVNDEYGIFSFTAEMTLKVWREEGELRVYQK